jgi:molybdenum cofactor cytidylyltransferase
MINLFNNNKGKIIVSRSAEGWSGVPALFDRNFFNALIKLTGDGGAKSVIRSMNTKTIIHTSRDDLRDIDTRENYLKMHYHKFKA